MKQNLGNLENLAKITVQTEKQKNYENNIIWQETNPSGRRGFADRISCRHSQPFRRKT